MNIVNAGCNYQHDKNFSINRPFGSGDYLFLVLRTDAWFILNSEKIISPANSLIIFKKGTPQLYGALSEKFVNDWIHFEISKDEEAEFEELGIPFDTILPVNNTNIFSELIKNIFLEKYSRNICKENSMKLYFNLILNKISEEIKSVADGVQKPYFEELCKLRNKIQLSPQQDWNIEKICKSMNLSRSYIQHLYKEFFGVSITSDILNGRIEYAKYLLSSTDFTVCRISDICGYENDVHFMRMFKKKMGTTPTEYRRLFKINKEEVENSKSQNPFCL